MLTSSGDLADSLVESDGAGNITADVTGNADTATALETSRNFSITGDITAAVQGFDGTGNVILTAAIEADTVGLSELIDGNVLGRHLRVLTVGTQKVSVYPGTVAVTGAGTISTGFTKHLECRIGQDGDVRVSRTHDNTTMYSRIYINGVAAAAGQGGSATTYTDDVSVSAGDLLQVYANCSTDGCTSDSLSNIWVGITDGVGVVGPLYV